MSLPHNHFRVLGLITLLAAVAAISYSIGTQAQKTTTENQQVSITPRLGMYLQSMPHDCQNTDIADATACVWRYASSTALEADTLAKGLVSGKLGQPGALVPGYPIFGGSNFQEDLSIGVHQAEQTRQGYIDTLCKLDSMNLYGGSGITLETGTCEYHYELQYLQVLKGLESKLIGSGS